MIPKFTTTAIGSLPFRDVGLAVEFQLNFLDLPCWPQLPQLSFLENMYAQFSQGFPGINIDEEKKKICIRGEDIDYKELEGFFKAVERENLEYFKISPEYAQGLYRFREEIKNQKLKFVKGQITGPVSFGFAITQENGEAIFYHDDLRNIMVQHLKMKALWQYSFLKEVADNVIIFLDEPYLASIGSGFITISEGDVQSALREIISALKNKGAITGIHCCGNTDWSKLITQHLEINIINYDSYNFLRSLLNLPQLIYSHIASGENYVAWGIVPSSKEIVNLSTDDIVARVEEVYNIWEKKGYSKQSLIEKSLLTPSCGTGTLEEKEARLVYTRLKELKNILTRRFNNG